MVRRSIVSWKVLLLIYHPPVYLQEANGCVVKALRCVVEDALQGTLDDAAGSQNTLAQFPQTLANLQRRCTACVNQVNATAIYWCLPVLPLLNECAKKPTYLRSKYVVPVMDEDPSQPPSRDQPAFSQATAAEDWHITADRCNGRTTATREDLGRQQEQDDKICSDGKIMHRSAVCLVIVGLMVILCHLEMGLKFWCNPIK